MNETVCRIPYEYLSNELNKMPKISLGKHKGNEVYRVYSDDYSNFREITQRSSSWKKAAVLYLERKRIKTMLSRTRKLKQLSGHDLPSTEYVVKNTDNKYGTGFFDGLVDRSCPVAKTSKYCYNGREFRSRAEVFFAEQLDKLGLEYKYDVCVSFGSRTLTFDFVVLFREFNRCIFIEYFGKCADPDYNHDNSTKIETVTNAKIYIGRDLFIMSGDDIYMPGPDMIRNMLIAIIANVSAYHIGMKN